MIESCMQQSIVLTTNGIIIFHIKLTELASFGLDYQAHSTEHYYFLVPNAVTLIWVNMVDVLLQLYKQWKVILMVLHKSQCW